MPDATVAASPAGFARAQLATLPDGASVVIVGHLITESSTTDQGERRYRDIIIVDHIGASFDES